MAVQFQSLRSGSAGNALLLWSVQTRLVFDFGIPAKRDCEALLERIARDYGAVTAVFITHLHGDHLSKYGQAVLEERQVPLFLPRAAAARTATAPPAPAAWYTAQPLTIGEFTIKPIRVRHAPGYPNHGFVITWPGRERSRKICLFTDLCRWTEELAEQVAESDFAYLEANHDCELLRQRPITPRATTFPIRIRGSGFGRRCGAPSVRPA